jgi:hypothetical protein
MIVGMFDGHVYNADCHIQIIKVTGGRYGTIRKNGSFHHQNPNSRQNQAERQGWGFSSVQGQLSQGPDDQVLFTQLR